VVCSEKDGMRKGEGCVCVCWNDSLVQFLTLLSENGPQDKYRAHINLDYVRHLNGLTECVLP